ncbi:MAG: hypothetical protein M4579_002642 [Chaenotheca gracillima]|nr:MAG: hypothetical protein M4579_002642 [Chaenotheca gracillima]
MATQKCVHKGCGKKFTDPEEECVYHPGPPIFHEGQKGWKCCKPRVLTFDEFLSIPPCTTGRHSTEEEAPAPAPAASSDVAPAPAPKPIPTAAPPLARQPQTQQPQAQEAPPPPPESDTDDPTLSIPVGKTCRRRGCGATYDPNKSREGESCVHHPGFPIFHEGQKGYTCCKRRVLEFDEFMKMEGCETKGRHMFVGSGGKRKAAAGGGGEETLETVRHDFYQTPSLVIASLYLKKIIPPTDTSNPERTTSITFPTSTSLALNLPTSDNKRYKAEWPLYAAVDTEKSTWKVMGTKLELSLVKAQSGQGWPVLRGDQRTTGEIIQVGGAGRA